MATLTQGQIDDIYNRLSEIGMTNEAEVFSKDPDNFNFGVLEQNPNFTDNYESVDALIADKNKIFGELWNRFEGKKLSESRLESIQKKYPWITRDEIDKWFDKTNEYQAMYEAEAKAEEKRNERVKEVKDWDLFRKILTSDYEKQRYIDTPEQALFGKYAPELGEAKETRWGSIGDLGAGVAAGALDLIPSKYVVPAGPLVRAARDEAHVLADSPYQKSQKEILGAAAADAAFGATTLGLANYRKANRVAGNLANPAAAAEMERQSIREGINLMDKMPTNTRNDMNAVIEAMPNSPLKAALTKDMAGSTFDKTKNWKDDVLKTQQAFDAVTDPSAIARTRDMASLGKTMRNDGLTPEAMSYLENASKYRSPTKIDKAEALVGRVLSAAKGNLGYPAEQATRVVTGANTNLIKPKESDAKKKEFNESVDRIISNYSMIWSKKSKPQGYDIPLIKAAYDKWLKEQDK